MFWVCVCRSDNQRNNCLEVGKFEMEEEVERASQTQSIGKGVKVRSGMMTVGN